MKVERLLVHCDCGSVATPLSLGVTSDKCLQVTSVCIFCGQIINTFYPLSELWKSCPREDMTTKKLAEAIDREIDRIVRPPLALKFSKEDKEFLHSLKIKEDE